MQAVILAAGMATRLRPLTKKLPKCLIELFGKPFLYYTLNTLLKNNIQDILIVVGFESEQIIDYVQKNFSTLNVTFITNDVFKETNNAYSLLLVEKYITKNWILIDSDVVFYPAVLEKLLKQKKLPVLIATKPNYNEESMKVQVDKDHSVIAISKSIQESNYSGESVGMELFSKEHSDILFSILKKRVVSERRRNEFYEESFQDMIVQGVQFYSVSVSKNLVMEIDTAEDLVEAQVLFRDFVKNSTH